MKLKLISCYYLLVTIVHLLEFRLFKCSIINETNIQHSYVSDVCDWQGSGSSNPESDRLIVPIYLRCSQGIIKWFYPVGGLRVVLKLGTGNKDFHGCIRVSQNSSRNARIYIKGRRQLILIYSHDDGKNQDLFRCFVSVHHFVALFIETDPNSHYPHDTVEFSYNLEEKNEATLEDKCELCSNQKIISSFCSTDFALIGKIIYYNNHPEVERTEFQVKPIYIYHFLLNDTLIDNFHIVPSAKSSSKLVNDSTSYDKLSQITLNRPLKCNSKTEYFGSYLFLGEQILGKYFIKCLLKLEKWKQLSLRATLLGQNQCHINEINQLIS